MGKMEIAAGPSSQALTGNKKKYSSKLGDDSWEFQAKPRGICGVSRHGCCGIGWSDVRLLIFALIVLYIFLGMFYWALITGAQEVRQEEWLELESRFFGPFSKLERGLYNISNDPVPKGDITIEEFEKFRDAAQGQFMRSYNRPDGCKLAADGNFLECDRDNKKDGLWALFPWVTDKIVAGELGNIAGCGTERRTYSSLERDGAYGNPNNRGGVAAEEWVLGDNTCLAYIPISAISQ